MKRSAFAPSPLPALPGGEAAHPAPLLIAFAGFSIAVGLAWTPDRLIVTAAVIALLLIWPAPSKRPLRVMLGFLPLLIVVPLLTSLAWRGFGGELRLPWSFELDLLPRGLLAAARMGLWILISARCLERLHPAALMARLPRDRRLARRFLIPLLTLSFLDLMVREAWLLERAWRARGGSGKRHWPSLILPLFRNLLARADTLADALSLRRFPDRWAGSPVRGPRTSDLLPVLLAAVLLGALFAPVWG